MMRLLNRLPGFVGTAVWLWVAAFAASGCRGPEEPPAPAQHAWADAGHQGSSSRVSWAAPREAQGAVLLEGPATVLAAPESSAAVAAPFAGRVARVLVQAGDTVSAGQVLVELTLPEVVRAAGEHIAAGLRLEAYARQRTQLLQLQEKGMARLADLAEADTRWAEAKAALQASAAVLHAAGVSSAEAAGVAKTGVVGLRSALAGTVVEMNAAVGEVALADGPPLARVVAVSAQGARIQAKLPRIAPEDARYEYLPPLGAPVPVQLVGRSPQVDARDATVSAWFRTTGPDAGAAAFPGGQSGRLRARAGDRATGVLIPARALTFREGHPHVWLRGDDGQPRAVEVEVRMLSGLDALVEAQEVSKASRVASDASALDVSEGGHHD